jgi:NTE family protein
MDSGTPSVSKKKIMVALQGGGAHTAYAWGVMDELLATEEFEIVAIGGTSGGAMVAAIVASALSAHQNAAGEALDDHGRRELARQGLRQFWSDVSALGDFHHNPYRFVANDFFPSWNTDGLPVPVILNAMAALTSPYQAFFGLEKNPVESAIRASVDFSILNRSELGPRLYICATNVRTGQATIFTRGELGPEHLLASACLPTVDRAIQIKGENYWDGGYVSDPSLTALVKYHCSETSDLVIVGVNPVVMRDKVAPKTAWEIIDRMNEVTFNASLISELKQIHATNELLEEVPATASAKKRNGNLYGKKKIFVHYIPPHESMIDLGVASKNNTAKPFLDHLEQLGRKVAKCWKAGECASGGAQLLGISSDRNFKALFIDAQEENAPPVRSPAPYLAHEGGDQPSGGQKASPA